MRAELSDIQQISIDYLILALKSQRSFEKKIGQSSSVSDEIEKIIGLAKPKMKKAPLEESREASVVTGTTRLL